jgi:hypothetical protein
MLWKLNLACMVNILLQTNNLSSSWLVNTSLCRIIINVVKTANSAFTSVKLPLLGNSLFSVKILQEQNMLFNETN